MIRSVHLLFFSIFFILVVTSGGFALADSDKSATGSLQDRYQQSKFFYNQLESNSTMSSDRGLWLKASRNFRKVYLADPKSELAPASLYMLGKIYFRMYQKFQHNFDLAESVAYYHDCATLFPRHRLADDSLLALGNIYANQYKDYPKASQYYSDIVSKHADGDMHPQAATQLKILSSKHNTALPEIMVGDSQSQKLTNVLPVNYVSSEDYSRVIIKTSGPATYSAQLLEQEEQTPRRLYIDFLGSYVEPQYRVPVPIDNGLLQQIRTGQYSQDIVRVVLDLESISTYKIFSLPDPFRVVVDIRGNKSEETPEISKPVHALQKPTLNSDQIVVFRDTKKYKVKKSKPSFSGEDNNKIVDTSNELSLAQQLGLGVRKIVIDPGHGGKDPGAIANGLKEKDVVLAFAKRLQKRLASTYNYEVILTRSEDTYLSLEERTAIANSHNADLFLSVHVNAHPISSVKGMETYFLNLTTDSEAMRVAAFENATSELQMSDLQDVLSAIMKNSKISESSRLAHNVHRSIYSGLQNKYKNIKDLGVKQAPFYVLIGAEMPAILIEMAFISNEDEAGMLQEDVFLDLFADHLSQGLEKYVHSNTARLTSSGQ